MHIYLDESGDLGWKFSAPFTQGGSSRYLTIAFLITTPQTDKYHKRLIRDFHNKFCIPASKEIKGSGLRPNQRKFVIEKSVAMLEKHPEISLHAITVNKTNVKNHIREDPNKLYNYMIGLILLDAVKNEQLVQVFPDPRTIKVKSGNSLIDYLQTKLWCEINVETRLVFNNITSEKCYGIRYSDWLSHLVWSFYELNKTSDTRFLMPYVNNKLLFFQEK